MVSRRPPQDADGSHHPGIAGQCPCLQRRAVQDRTRPAVRPLCLRHADCRQLYQRPLRLPERDRPPGRPAGSAARLRRRLDYADRHENRYRHRTDAVVPGRAGSAVHRLGAAAPRRLGTGGVGRGVHTLCFPLHHAALLSGLGRRAGAGVLRLRARMWHLLRAGLYAEYGCGGTVARQWVGDRYPADGEQLSRPRAGRSERQVYAGSTLRQEVR